MADNTFNTKKFLDQAGVTTLWSRIAAKVKAEEDRAKQVEAANAAAAKKAQDDVDALKTYVGTIPETYTESNIVAFIQKRAQEVLTAAQGDSSDVQSALDAYIALNDPKVTKNTTDIATIMGDYLKKADKDELEGDIADNAAEILRIDAALKAAIDDEDGAGLDSIKDLATWIETHGEEAAGYAQAIQALEGLVGDTAVATQIANAIAQENLSQYAKTADIQGTLDKVDTQGTVSAAISAAVDALKIGDYAKAADLTALATRVTALENADHQSGAQVTASIEAAIAALKAENLWDAKGAAATAEANAKAYADSLAGNYDAKGSAAAAETNAKAHSDANLETAKAYSDANLKTAKSYSDTNLSAAKTYTDNAYNAIQALSTAEIDAAIANATAQS
jgi:hypothetical protein